MLGTDASRPPSLGALFRVPITVIKPHADLSLPGSPPSYSYAHGAAGGVGGGTDGFLPFTPGHVERRFVVPPAGATWATVKIEARPAARSRELAAGPAVYMVHTTQVRSPPISPGLIPPDLP